MTTPQITPYSGGVPDSTQSDPAFTENVFDYLAWQLGPFYTGANEIANFVTTKADEVAATALTGDLPPLTGQAGRFLRVNTGETAAEFADVSTPVELSQVQAESSVSTVFGQVSGQRLAQAVAANTPAPNELDFVDVTNPNSFTFGQVNGFLLAQAIDANRSTYADGVGSYVWATDSFNGSLQFVYGNTYAGIDLSPAGFGSGFTSQANSTVFYESGWDIGVFDENASSLSGTWRCMGQTPAPASTYTEQPLCLFVRIA
jgi:hypothetical protein